MKVISFSWTTPALLAGAKTVTRRDWNPRYAESFRVSELVAAYDRSPRYGGRQVGTIRLLRAPYRENIADAPEDDYIAEGLQWMNERGIEIQRTPPELWWAAWRRSKAIVWVVRFDVVEFTTAVPAAS